MKKRIIEGRKIAKLRTNEIKIKRTSLWIVAYEFVSKQIE